MLRMSIGERLGLLKKRTKEPTADLRKPPTDEAAPQYVELELAGPVISLGKAKSASIPDAHPARKQEDYPVMRRR